MLTLSPMEEGDARAVLGWRYPPPYDMYNAGDEPSDPACMSAEAGHWSVRDEAGTLLAFLCFGEEARVHGGDYSSPALDIGCGLRPDVTGQGMGPEVITAAVDLGRERYGADRFRATIAEFNIRAQRATERAGFQRSGRFTRPSDGLPFVILTLGPEDPLPTG